MYAKRNYRKKRSVKSARKTSRRPRASRGVTTAVKKYVSRSIHSNIENKVGYWNAYVNVASYVNMLNTLQAYPLTPFQNHLSITQTVTQSGRIANMVKTRSLILNYVIYPNSYDATYNPNPVAQEVKIWIGFKKNQPLQQPTDFTKFFQQGDTAVAPVSNLDDLLKPVNRDLWAIKKQITHKIGFASATGTGAVPGSQYFANNDFKMNAVRSVNLTSICPKTFKFDDTYSNSPCSGHGLFMMIESVSADGNTGGAGIPIRMRYWLTYSYEDA